MIHGTSGKRDLPKRYLIHGREKVGKTTLAAGAPAPAFICCERGADDHDVFRMSIDDKGSNPTTWQHLLDLVEHLRVEPHDYKTAVVDSLDLAEPWCWAYTCVKHNEKEIDSADKGSKFCFKKGFDAALHDWRWLLSRLELLVVERGMSVILTTHTERKNHKDPSTPDYQFWGPALEKKASAVVEAWADAVLFAVTEVQVAAQDGRNKAMGDGERVLWSVPTPAWVAGSRMALPARMPMRKRDPWGVVVEGRLQCEITSIIEETGEPKRTKALELLTAAGSDIEKLTKLQAWLNKKESTNG